MTYSFQNQTPILLYTPKELIEKIVKRVEKERLRQNVPQKELAKIAGIPLATYRNFVYKKQISLENLKTIQDLVQNELNYNFGYIGYSSFVKLYNSYKKKNDN